MIDNTLTHFQSYPDGLANVVSQLQQDKQYGPISPSSTGNDALGLFGAFLGMAAALVPVAGGAAAIGEGLNLLSTSVGVASGGIGIRKPLHSSAYAAAYVHAQFRLSILWILWLQSML